jgi:hypothetical protein
MDGHTNVNFLVGLLSICNFFFVPCKIVYRLVATNCCFMRRARIGTQLSPEGVYFYWRAGCTCYRGVLLWYLKYGKSINFLVLFGRRTWPVVVERCWNTCMIWCEKFVVCWQNIETNGPFGRHSRWGGDVKSNFLQTGFTYLNWNKFCQDGYQWRTVVSTAMNICTSLNAVLYWR